MDHTLIFDCEFLSAEGSPSRFWCGPYDPDPVVVQIGIVKLGLTGRFPILDTMRTYVVPRDRHGKRRSLDPFFTRLTGITEENISADGTSLSEALEKTDAFADGAKLWSWGKDEFNMIAISCFVEGFAPPMLATQFGNACDLLLKAGMPYEDLKKTRSQNLTTYFGIDCPDLRDHDALDDALSVAYVVQHLLGKKALSAADFT